MEIVKFISLFVVLWLGTVTALRMIYKLNVPLGNFLWTALALTTFLFLQFHL